MVKTKSSPRPLSWNVSLQQCLWPSISSFLDGPAPWSQSVLSLGTKIPCPPQGIKKMHLFFFGKKAGEVWGSKDVSLIIRYTLPLTRVPQLF